MCDENRRWTLKICRTLKCQERNLLNTFRFEVGLSRFGFVSSSCSGLQSAIKPAAAALAQRQTSAPSVRRDLCWIQTRCCAA